MRSPLALAGLLAMFVAPALRAQQWKDSEFPYITSAANDFPVIAARFTYRKAADYFAPYISAGSFNVDAGVGFRGSRFATATFRAPGLWPGWRLKAEAGGRRDGRFGFFGFGNDTKLVDSLQKADPLYYRVKRTRYFATAEATRWVKPRLGVALASGVEVSRFTDVRGTDLFQQTYGSNIEDTDVTGRLTLLYDSRDTEFNTHRGVFVEGSGLIGSGGNGYQRLSFIARGYLPLRTGTIIAARLGGAGVLGAAPLIARYEIAAWEQEVSVYGGEQSNRGTDDQRYAGEDVLFGNLEIRHDLLNAGDYGAVTLLAFVDVGRVFEGEPFRLTTENLKVGKGVGIALRILRSNILKFSFADGPDGFKFLAGSGWMF